MASWTDYSKHVKLIMPLLVIIMVCSVCRGEGESHPPKNMVVYAHESREPSSRTVIVSAEPPAENGSEHEDARNKFGLIRTVSNILRDGEASDSMLLGSQVGIVVVGKDGTDVYISFTYFFNETASFKGTIAVHGHIDGTTRDERTFAVVGGTGDFLAVTGVDVSGFDIPDPPDPSNVVNVHYLTLYYPQWKA